MTYSLSASESFLTGYGGGLNYSTALSGSLGYLSSSPSKPFSLVYSGGFLYSSVPGYPSASTFQNLAASPGVDHQELELCDRRCVELSAGVADHRTLWNSGRRRYRRCASADRGPAGAEHSHQLCDSHREWTERGLHAHPQQELFDQRLGFVADPALSEQRRHRLVDGERECWAYLSHRRDAVR